MAVQLARVDRVPRRMALAGWVADASYHVVINEKGAPPAAEGRLRYPSEAPGSVQFPAEVGPLETWEGWIDGLNVGGAAGDFQCWLSSTNACTGDIDKSETTTLEPNTYVPIQVLGGPGPADFYICFMRYVPLP